MATTGTEATATTTGLPVTSSLSDNRPEPAWLTHIKEEMLRDDFDDDERGKLTALRTMLEAPGDDAVAAKQAARTVLDLYNNGWLREHPKWLLGLKDHGLVHYLADIAQATLELGFFVSYGSSELNRAFLLLIELEALGPEAFGVKVQIHLPYQGDGPKADGICSNLGPRL